MGKINPVVGVISLNDPSLQYWVAGGEDVHVTNEDVCDRCGTRAHVFAYDEYLCSQCFSRGPLEGAERRLRALRNHIFEGVPLVYEVGPQEEPKKF